MDTVIAILLFCILTWLIVMQVSQSSMRRKVEALLPRRLGIFDLMSHKCRVCGCIDSQKEFSGMLIDVNLNGADATRCEICGSIVMHNELFIQQLSLLNDPHHVYYRVAELMEEMTMVLLKRGGNEDKVVAALNWHMDYRQNYERMIEEYIPTVIKRAKAEVASDLDYRLAEVVEQDFRDTFLTNKEVPNIEKVEA